MKQKELNAYLANIAVELIKLHNLHWNCVGRDFPQMHLYLEEMYDEIFEYMDQVAEIQRMDGLVPDSNLKTYLEKATIEELESKEISTKDVLGHIKADLTVLKDQATALRKLLDEEDHFSGVALMEDHIESYRKRLWFVESMQK